MFNITGTARRYLLMKDVGWGEYIAMLDGVPGPTRLTFDAGQLEFETLSPEHQRHKTSLFQLINILTEELDLPLRCFGSMTMKREDLAKGFEPDECFYIQNEGRVAGMDRYDPAIHPAPDLVVEVDVTHRSIDRQAICAAMCVPDFWRFDGRVLRFFALTADGDYRRAERSPTFPTIPADDLARFARRDEQAEDNRWKRAFREWVRGRLRPNM